MNTIVGLSYGCHPPKIAKSINCSLEEAQLIFDRYHKELYPEIDDMRAKVDKIAHKQGYVNLGLGCKLYSNNPERDTRTLFNANSQFWSILTLLTINKLNKLIEENNLEEDVVVVSSIYDSIYLHITANPEIIKWVNDTIIPIMKTDFLEDTIVHNEAVGEISYNWCDGIELNNNASLDEIKEALIKAKELL